MTNGQITIFVEPAARAKPRAGEPCNGCGVCCLVQPCPLGMLLSRRRAGACDALRWDGRAIAYRCGAVAQPEAVLRHVFPTALGPAASWLAPILAKVARRAIATGIGCDSDLEPGRPSATAGS